MPFYSLQPNSKIFILNKEPIPTISNGEVVSVSQPRPCQNNWQQMVVTVVARVDGADRTFENLPSDKDMADSMTGLQLYCNCDMLINEVKRMHRESEQALAEEDKHRARVKACDGILLNLCPEVAEKAAREQELDILRKQMDEMRSMFMQVMDKVDTAKTEGHD